MPGKPSLPLTVEIKLVGSFCVKSKIQSCFFTQNNSSYLQQNGNGFQLQVSGMFQRDFILSNLLLVTTAS